MGKYVLRGLALVMFTALFMMLTGCGSEGTTVNSTTDSASGIVTGRVIDSSTLQPVKNADVDLLANGVKMTAKSSASADPDLAGTFVFNSVSPTAHSFGHTLKITAPGFATMQRIIDVVGSSNNTPSTTSLGNIALGKGFDLTVIATDDGTPIAGVTINASTNWAYDPGITAVTDANGAAILKGLNQEITYGITSAPVYDGAGLLKYVSTSLNQNNYSSLSGQTVSLPLVSATRHDNIQIVGSNLLGDGTVNYSYPYRPNQSVITPDGVIKIVFNYPVTLAAAVTATYVNNLVPSTDPGYGDVISVPTISASLDQTGTILTIVNAVPYQKNQSYTFNGTLTAEVNSLTQFFSLSSVPSNPFFASSVYVTDNTATGLSPLTLIKADNFNATTGATATTVPESVSLEFPEKVYGTYRVLTTKSGGVTTVVDAAAVSFGFANGTIEYAVNSGGADNAVVFRVPTYLTYWLSLADNSAANVNEVTINFNVTDAEGNNFSKTVTLPVQ